MSRHDYAPFGEELFAGVGVRTTGASWLSTTQADGQRKQFGEYDRDGETGLDFLRFRYYSSLHGRFLKPDSFGGRLTNPQTLNLYAYVINNPLKWVDPTGHSAQDPKKDSEPIGYDEDGNPIYDCDDCKEVIDSPDKRVGQPGFWESLIPFWGSGRSAVDYYQTGHPWKGTLYTGLAVTDVFLVRSLATGVGKLGFRLFAKEATEQVIVKEALVEAGVKEVTISASKYPESAAHVLEAQAAGYPSVLTVDRAGATARRVESLKDIPKIPGKQLDEYPAAMFKENGGSAAVRPITPVDNMGAGASFGNQLRNVPDGTKVRIRVVE
ncbi:MAG: hypothetical protein JNJ50_25275 [Acidobacteria bacterium]|nr:hypothetical protein [Acidobacteriota bacterium]